MKTTARSFLDLIVYQNLYKTMITVLTKVVTKLPKEEKFDLASQMRRAAYDISGKQLYRLAESWRAPS